jgi:hypothetical protein
MKFTANKTYVFYPDVNGNLELQESERLSVEIIRPTAEDRGDICWPEGTAREARLEEISTRVRFNTSRILRRHVGEIRNMVITGEDGREKTIRKGEELAAASFVGMNALVDKICAEVCADYLTEAQKKISQPGSSSSGPDGPGGN